MSKSREDQSICGDVVSRANECPISLAMVGDAAPPVSFGEVPWVGALFIVESSTLSTRLGLLVQ